MILNMTVLIASYFGSAVDSPSELSTDVHSEVMTANRACIAHVKLLRFYVLSQSAKLKLQ